MHLKDPLLLVEGDDDFPTDTSCDCAETRQRLARITDEVAVVLLGEGSSEAVLEKTLHSNPPEFPAWVALGSQLEHRGR
jgi:hypothetical protein